MIEFQTEKPELYVSLEGEGKATFTLPRQKLEIIDQLQPNKKYDVTIKQHQEKRSIEANAYAWVLISAISEAVNASKDDIYLKMLKQYGQSEIVSVKSNIAVSGYFRYYEEFGQSTLKGIEFTHYKVFKGSSDFDTKEMSVFIDGIVSEAQGLGIDTRTPEQLAELKSLWKTEAL